MMNVLLQVSVPNIFESNIYRFIALSTFIGLLHPNDDLNNANSTVQWSRISQAKTPRKGRSLNAKKRPSLQNRHSVKTQLLARFENEVKKNRRRAESYLSGRNTEASFHQGQAS
jgi:hypothetical protein